jgi:hypothetical protein
VQSKRPDDHLQGVANATSGQSKSGDITRWQRQGQGIEKTMIKLGETP